MPETNSCPHRGVGMGTCLQCRAEAEETATATQAAVSTVDHPPHYGGADNPYEAIKVIEAWGLGFCLGNALKYLARAGKKHPARVPLSADPATHQRLATIEDLQKARWYLDREIQRLEQAAPPSEVY